MDRESNALRSTLLAPGLLALSACAANVPIEIREPPADNPPLGAVVSAADQYTGRKARWGGAIVAVENKTTETWVELAARSLGAYGEPEVSDVSEGRFIARISGFLDPSIYRQDRELTVYGTITDHVTRKIGELPYTYPVVTAEKVYLWPDYPQYGYPNPYGPYWYDPFYDPFYYGWYYRTPYMYPRYGFGYYPYW